MKYLILSKKMRHSLSGFTLVELMVSAIASVAIISAAGYGLVAILGSKNTADASSTQRQTLDRALNYITDEVRSASTISNTGSTTGITGFPVLATGSQVVMVLTVNNLPQPIVYYTAPAQSPWLGPVNIVRWGPDINSDGSYNTASYNSRVLVDLINNAGASNSCTTGWSSVPSIANRQGFYACVDASGQAADIYLLSLFTDGSGKSSTYSVQSRMNSRRISKLPSS
jgi:type II secretory pathway pseudopilin PulG